MRTYACQFCKAPLPKRGARCRGCGWAANYDQKTKRQQRELALGLGITMVAIVLAIALAIALTYYVKPLP